ncbi:MAG: hypothetical protein AB1758_19710 [Candidatus Eremiobacterota bacterium]
MGSNGHSPLPERCLLAPSPDFPPPPDEANRLLSLLRAFRSERATLSRQTILEIETRLYRMARQVGLEGGIFFLEASYIDEDTVCVVLTDDCTRADLLVDPEWNLSGAILFGGLTVRAVRGLDPACSRSAACLAR